MIHIGCVLHVLWRSPPLRCLSLHSRRRRRRRLSVHLGIFTFDVCLTLSLLRLGRVRLSGGHWLSWFRLRRRRHITARHGTKERGSVRRCALEMRLEHLEFRIGKVAAQHFYRSVMDIRQCRGRCLTVQLDTHRDISQAIDSGQIRRWILRTFSGG